MASLPSTFWGGWILVITVTTFLALLWFVIDVYRGGGDGNENIACVGDAAVAEHALDVWLRDGQHVAEDERERGQDGNGCDPGLAHDRQRDHEDAQQRRKPADLGPDRHESRYNGR